jgi:carbon monoxide dehydrogenase subunit G
MNSVQRELVVDKEPEAVWEFVKDMGKWASQMPGYMSHELLNDDDSVWTLNVNFGPFARPVVIDVHVTQWVAPSQVTFEVKGRSDPFRGSGAFEARKTEAGTAISLQFGAEGTGSMAKMISAMVPPVLNFMGDGFSANLAKALSEGLSAKQTSPRGIGLREFWRHLVQQILAFVRRSRAPERR